MGNVFMKRYTLQKLVELRQLLDIVGKAPSSKYEELYNYYSHVIAKLALDQIEQELVDFIPKELKEKCERLSE